ncbi:2-oxo acid dehydrogenase subunit E2 [Nocardioides sp. Soil796]|uniref:2-oxo acid dehydrogenase subunit E2 n=1 Tax=Nocardioides sp. Soil796 TaxID=1736412 RepID=UPI00070926F4|nr:2-oxo acid dehydrogenase subunit E2 [Nocardioides sp. Soil796]KRF16852.1 hypothetical protein ASH02_01970 [Nocardioides sp. Soil796]
MSELATTPVGSERAATPAAALPEQREVRRPIRGIRRVIAQRMALSHAEIPGVHVVEEVDVTHLDLRRLVAVSAAATARVVAHHPVFNAHVVDREIVEFTRCDVAVAVDTPHGLMAPVVRDCGRRSVDEIQSEIDRLADLARVGKLAPADLIGATITVTSPGKRGGVLATPLINHPQTAIIGLHRATERVVVRDGAFVVRKMANLTVTFDHRVIDGAEAGDVAIELRAELERAHE